MSSQFKNMVEMFAPGDFYFWILNFQNFEIEYVHPRIEKNPQVRCLYFHCGTVLLSEKELEIIELPAQGKSTSEMAFQLDKSET